MATPASGVILAERLSQCAFGWNEETTQTFPDATPVREKMLDPTISLLYGLSILQNPESGIYYPFFEPDVNVKGHLEHVG